MTRTLQPSLFAAAVSFILTQEFIVALENVQTKYQVYYDGEWKPVPLLAATNVSTVTRTPQRRYGLIPCECADLQCGCCVNTNFFSTQRSGCMNMTYDPQEFAVGMNMLWNGESVYQNSVSAKNPPPACMEAPIPYLPSIQFCIRLFDIYTAGRNIHMCVNFETRVARAPILILEFDCVQMGADGIDHLKFNTTQSSSMGEIASDLQDTNAASVDIPSSIVSSSTTENQESTDIFRITANTTGNPVSSDIPSTVNSTETPSFTVNSTETPSSTDTTRVTTNKTETLSSSDITSTAYPTENPASSDIPSTVNSTETPSSTDTTRVTTNKTENPSSSDITSTANPEENPASSEIPSTAIATENPASKDFTSTTASMCENKTTIEMATSTAKANTENKELHTSLGKYDM